MLEHAISPDGVPYRRLVCRHGQNCHQVRVWGYATPGTIGADTLDGAEQHARWAGWRESETPGAGWACDLCVRNQQQLQEAVTSA